MDAVLISEEPMLLLSLVKGINSEGINRDRSIPCGFEGSTNGKRKRTESNRI